MLFCYRHLRDLHSFPTRRSSDLPSAPKSSFDIGQCFGRVVHLVAAECRVAPKHPLSFEPRRLGFQRWLRTSPLGGPPSSIFEPRMTPRSFAVLEDVTGSSQLSTLPVVQDLTQWGRFAPMASGRMPQVELLRRKPRL